MGTSFEKARSDEIVVISTGESLDTAIKELAFTMAKLGFIRIVDYSCSGHLAQTGNHGWRNGYYAFGQGYYPFGIKEVNEISLNFLKEVDDFCQQFKQSNLRSSLRKPHKEWDNYSILLDLVSEDGTRLANDEKFVPQEMVSEVGNTISEFWNHINEIANKYLSDKECLTKVTTNTARTVDIIIHGSHIT